MSSYLDHITLVDMRSLDSDCKNIDKSSIDSDSKECSAASIVTWLHIDRLRLLL